MIDKLFLEFFLNITKFVNEDLEEFFFFFLDFRISKEKIFFLKRVVVLVSGVRNVVFI